MRPCPLHFPHDVNQDLSPDLSRRRDVGFRAMNRAMINTHKSKLCLAALCSTGNSRAGPSPIQEYADRAHRSVMPVFSNESRNIPGGFSLFQNQPVPDPGPTSSTARNIRWGSVPTRRFHRSARSLPIPSPHGESGKAPEAHRPLFECPPNRSK